MSRGYRRPSVRSALGTACLSLTLYGLSLGGLSLRAADEFPAAPDTQDAQDVVSTPEAALGSIVAPPGFQSTLFAAEPAVRQPIAITTDERGRLWVAENYTYAESKTNFDLRLRDRIVVLEDSDGDGRHDKRTVFWDQGQRLTSVEVGFGGVWALCAPHLLFIPDRDRDDVPDGPAVVVLDGWDGAAVRHNIVNGLKWGPDGWLYGRHGILATSSVGQPGAAESQRTRMNCGIWRYHPTRKIFEVVAVGTTNPWGFDYDDHGQMFFINTVIGHLWHVVPGAHYRRMYGADSDRRTYQLLEQTADHFHWDTGEAWSDIRKGVSPTTSQAGGGHAHSGLMIYLGDNWPAEYRHRMFTLNLHGRRVNQDLLERSGAAYVGKHAPDFLTVGDRWFRGLDLVYGPDGGVLIADWTDVGECHENDGVHRSSGRIFKVAYGRPAPQVGLDLARKSNVELVALQTHANDWFVRQSRRLLQERAAAGRAMDDARTALLAMFDGPHAGRVRLRALWCLAGLGVERSWLLQQLSHEDEHVRVWAVRLLADQGLAGSDAAPAVAGLTELARRETSGLVQLFLASALQRMAPAARWPIAESLATRGEFAADPTLPLMIWYGLEPAVATDRTRAIAMCRTTTMPLVRRHLARRLAEDWDGQPQAVEALVAMTAREASPAMQADLVRGIGEALRGWRKAAAPPSWEALRASLERDGLPDARQAARELSIVFGDGRAVDELTALVLDGRADLETRRQALRTLGESKADGVLKLLQKQVSNRDLAVEAVRGLANYADAETPGLILGQFPRFNPEARAEAIATLASRPSYAAALLAAMAEGKIARGQLSAFHARQIRSFEDATLNEPLLRLWGDVRPTAADKLAAIHDWKRRLADLAAAERKPDEGMLAAGRQTFQTVCAGCHVLYGQGRQVGPDLTGANRQNLDYLLENILDPSATVAVDFRTSVAVLKDGRAVTGVASEQTARTVVLQTAKERLTIAREEIEELRATGVSLMPDGLLNNLSPQQTRALFAYLMSREQPGTRNP